MLDKIRRRVLVMQGKPLPPSAEPKLSDEFGLWGDPDTALEQFDLLQAHNILPFGKNGNGWMDQPEHVRENLVILKTLFAEQADADQPGKPRLQPKPPKAEAPPEKLPESATLNRLGFGRRKG